MPSTISQEYWASDMWNREKKSSRFKYWSMLRSAKDEFFKLAGQEGMAEYMDDGAFYYYVKQTYGLEVEVINGMIGQEYAIVDEKKYLMFLLKFGS
jgi:hypothetical protein